MQTMRGMQIVRNTSKDLDDGTAAQSKFSANITCQRRSKNASDGRSKNTSIMLARRPPHWEPFR
jgi:hypothetical protein